MRNISIAIDGYSSTGKSTLARQLARELEYVYIDSGAMYRAVTLFALRNGLIGPQGLDADGLLARLPELEVGFRLNPQSGRSEVTLNGENVEGDIRTLEVSRQVSEVSTLGPVREKLVAVQRAMSRDGGVVMDGRDIGTVVLPDAELKLFMTASPEIRASRRYKELLDRGEQVKYEDVLKNVRHRDYLDSHREISPLRQAEDAIELDNSDMGLKEQFERVLAHARRVAEAQ
ncbi:(d)CMP kinase [Robiginitalea sp. M366]|uniref:(d)CMP kinase n=1 Tax=Robiginitalea aestuariiviva TaxID=3036903 RepID=UPI00240CFA36|nr:(d)CMP kinase [Robiginitalea aestuariiviva]MDG1572600.1 (d)CMP kinase [Robiginitalea aestuariiviva]